MTIKQIESGEYHGIKAASIVDKQKKLEGVHNMNNGRCCSGVLRLDAEGSSAAGSVNSTCHGYTGGVTEHNKHVIPYPRIVLIFWDSYFASTPAAITSMQQFISDLVVGPYMDGLAQYGISWGALAGSFVINTTSYPPPSSLTETQLQSQLITWLNNGVITPAPAGDETNLVYLIFPPSTTTLTLQGSTDGFCGYHSHGNRNSSSGNDNLFWAVVRGYEKSPDGKRFVDSISYCVSHELVETFSNRDGQGFYASNGCEIGDLCEADGSGNVTTVPYRGWQVEKYWSQQAGACISQVNWWHGWYGLGGQITEAPTVTVVHTGLTDIYVQGKDNRLWQKWWDGKRWNPSDAGWLLHDDGGFRLGSAPAVISGGDNFRDIYVRGQDGGVYHKYWDGHTWSQWFGLGGQIIGAPAVTAVRPGFTDIYVQGKDNRLWQKWWDGKRWNPSDAGWLLHDDGGFRLGSAPAVISGGDNFRDIYVRGQDGGVYHKYWDGHTWSQWFGLGGQIIGAPAVTAVRPGFTDIYVQGKDNRLWQKWWDGKRWNPSDTGWTMHDDGGFRLGGAPAVISDGNNFRDIYVRGQDSVVYHKYWLAGS